MASVHELWLSISPPGQYGLCMAFLLAAWVSYLGGCTGGRWLRRLWVRCQRQTLRSSVPALMQFLDIESYAQALVLLICLAANIVALCLSARSFADTQRRAGILGVIHLMPLCASPSFSFVSHVLYIDRETVTWLHRWAGRIFMVHCVLHGTMIVKIGRVASVYTLTAGPTLIALVVWPGFLYTSSKEVKHAG